MIDAPAGGPPTGAVVVPPPLPARRSRRRHPVARAFGAIVGWLSAGLATAGLIAHFLDTTHQSLILLAAGAWVLAPFSIVALVLHLWRRGWIAVAAVVVLVVCQSLVYAPLFVAQAPPSSPAGNVTVLTQNLLYGGASATQLVQRVRSGQVDVFAAQELTKDSVAALRSAGLEQVLPYSALDPRPQSAGTGIWSRYPIADPQRLATRDLAGVVVTVTLPGGTRFTALSLHPAAPFPQDPAEWYSDLDRIRRLLVSLPDGPVIAAGDFNATLDHARFRRLLVDGWHDGAEQAGAGLVRSWPSDLESTPALVEIDHVLTRGPVVTDLTIVPTQGSDHLGLLATVVVPG